MSIEEPITCVAVKKIKRFRLLRVSVFRVSDEMVSVRGTSDNLNELSAI